MTRKRILVVDDEYYILTSLQRVLEDDFEVSVAMGGQLGLESLSQKDLSPDAILCDISMPNISGADFYHSVKKQFPGLEEKIIFMTGGIYTDELRKFVSSVKNTCLAKPFEQSELHQVLKNIFLSNPK